ncbi:phosphonate ABC transporter, permease protein PhnE [Rhodococcus spongiicola]|uniref:Phosphonate ABC transporter, permease protein PhnE n=1 Tax=Rhodococcus spongiicola TaxID=2487352 RepID=A0A438AUI7_9NOCA|nr:phosphonate ABC transporter, permease protein PhnE [Rhodococcus spongiicola]RVW02400.1 phosphonate ABC transporter, permease protein PhnE [Rhodococcus spongiicola]
MSVDHKASPTAAPKPPSPQLESSGRRNLLWARNIVVVLAVLAFLGWSASDLGLSPQRFIEGIPRLVEFLLRMFPPDLTVIPGLWDAILTTVAVALWGTLLAMFISFFLALGAARNLLGHNPLVYAVSRTILSIQRSLPDLIWALIFVAAVGLGPFPGVLALTVYSCGELSKLYAEAVENIDPGPREALESTGAGLFTTLRWSVIPQILPEVITYSLYRLESNVRHAFVLGMVGAGGLGFELSVSMRLFQYHKVSAILIIIIVTVATIDFISSRIRARVI